MGFFKKITDRVYKKAINLGSSSGDDTGINKEKMNFMLMANDLKNSNGFIEILNDPLVDEDYIDQTESINYNFDNIKFEVKSKDGSTAVVLTRPQKATIIPNSCMVTASYVTPTKGSAKFHVSRNGGTTWTEVAINSVINLEGQPPGSEMVMKVVLTGDTILKGWSLMWNQSGDRSGGGLGSGREGILGGAYKNRITLNSSTNTVNIGLPEFDINTCVLFVYQNSTYIDNPGEYTISDDGTLIIKKDGMWETGTVLDIIAFELVETTTTMLRDIKFNTMVVSKQLDIGFTNKLVDTLDSLKNITTSESENYAINREKQFLYCNAADPAEIFFDTINTADDVSQAVIVSDYDDGNSGFANFYLSRDNGTTWDKVDNGVIKDLSSQPSGSDLRVKVELSEDAKVFGLAILWSLTE